MTPDASAGRERLRAIARRAMTERGLLPDFSPEALATASARSYRLGAEIALAPDDGFGFADGLAGESGILDGGADFDAKHGFAFPHQPAVSIEERGVAQIDDESSAGIAVQFFAERAHLPEDALRVVTTDHRQKHDGVRRPRKIHLCANKLFCLAERSRNHGGD